MREISELRGLRFPDEYVVRMFFKERLQRASGRALELGCGSGNNLLLFHEFGWQVVGIDVSENAIADAQFNLQGTDQSVTLICADLAEGMPNLDGEFDAIILPSFNYYVPRAQFVELLKECNRLLKRGGVFYIRSRTPADWRFGRGIAVEHNGFTLECTETGEQGCLNVFYTADELKETVDAGIGELTNYHLLKVHYENIQSETVIANDDVVLWGRR